MSSLGIGDDDFVVAYDDAGGSIAARLWWMLRATDHQAAVLDGGVQAWTGSLESGPATPRLRATFAARPWPPDAVVDANRVAAALDQHSAVVFDARAPERY